MFGIGTTELVVILVVALIVVGPKKLPQIARTLGKAMGEFKRVSTDLHRTINTEVEMQERKEREKEEKKKLADEKGKDETGAEKKAPAEKSEEDIAAEKSYQSAVAANTPVQPEEKGDKDEKAQASAPEHAGAEESPVIDVKPEENNVREKAENAGKGASATGDKA